MINRSTTADTLRDIVDNIVARGESYIPSCKLCRKFVNSECSDMLCTDWICKLADSIEQDVKYATYLNLRDLMETNDLPPMTEDESFGEYIHRCYAVRQVIGADGKPIKAGDAVRPLYSKKTCGEVVCVRGGKIDLKWLDGTVGEGLDPTHFSLAELATDADGERIEVGDVVYWVEKNDENLPWKVIAVENGKVTVKAGTWIVEDNEPAEFTHKEPDTQKKINADAAKSQVWYWECVGKFCAECPARINGKTPYERYGVNNCRVAQNLDLLRRQCELDAKKGGSDA